MANFVPGNDVVTATPKVEVDAGPALAPGRHRFRLIVEDDTGNLSLPAFIDVVVPAPPAPEGEPNS